MRLFTGGREFLARATAFENAAGGFQRGQGRAIGFAPGALSEHLAVPFEAEGLEYAQVFVSAAGHHTGRVEILDAHQPARAVRTRVEITADRGQQ